MTSAVIVDAVRTASGRGKPGGALAHHHPADLLGRVLRALVDRHDLDPALIDDVIGGCLGQIRTQAVNVTRNAVLSAGFPDTVPATTIDRQCGSSQQAVHFAAQGVAAGAYDLVIACGVELMSAVPIAAATLGEDPYGPRIAERYPGGLVGQGISAELISARWGLGRDELDAYAARSHARAAAADFSGEILPIDGHGTDETVRAGTTAEKLAELRPAFEDERMRDRFPEIDWRITAGNSSPLTDGASAVLIASEAAAERLGLPVRARFRAFDVIGSNPVEMLTAIIPATRRVLDKAGVRVDDIDAFEVNEAFAPVPLAWQRELDADPDRLNPRGGAIALGHALGSSGTRLLTTLLTTLESTGGRLGLQTMCEGGGMANALVLERV